MIPERASWEPGQQWDTGPSQIGTGVARLTGGGRRRGFLDLVLDADGVDG